MKTVVDVMGYRKFEGHILRVDDKSILIDKGDDTLVEVKWNGKSRYWNRTRWVTL